MIQQAFRLEWLTIAWMVIEALVAIGSSVIAGSLTLTAFGLDSVIELVSAGVLICRLTEELRRGGSSGTNPDRWQQILQLYHAALERINANRSPSWQNEPGAEASGSPAREG